MSKQPKIYFTNGVDEVARYDGTDSKDQNIPPATFIENTGHVQFTPVGEYKVKLKNGEIIDLNPEDRPPKLSDGTLYPLLKKEQR